MNFNVTKTLLGGKLSKRIAAVFAAAALFAPGAYADDFPNKPIQIVAAVSAGSANDILARQLAEKLQTQLKVPVIVVNKPGGGNVVATDFVAKSDPDGYTLLLANSALAFSPVLYSQLPYDPVNDFRGVGVIGKAPFIVVINSETGVKTIKDLIALAKEQPGTLNYASGGLGSATHLACYMLGMQADINITHVPYTSLSALGPDLVANRVQMMCSPLSPWLSMIKSGKVVALGVSQDEPMTDPIEVPSIKQETGVDYAGTQWYTLIAPSKTPQATMDRLGAAVQTVLESPDFQKQLESAGLYTDNPPLILQDADAFLKRERELWAPVAAATGVKLD